MGGDDPHRDSGGHNGVRRRRSTQHEDESGFELEGRPSGTPQRETYDRGEGEPATADPPTRPTTSSTTGIDPSAPATTPLSPLDNSPRVVRFSTDFEREALAEFHKQTQTSTQGGRALIEASSKPPAYSHSYSNPGLTIDTRRNQGDNTSGRGGSSVGSPDVVVSPPLSPSSRASLVSPLSPSSRNRGYSLRRAIFNRNMPEVEQRDGSAMELQESGSSSQAIPRPIPFGSSPKKASEAKVTIIETQDSLASTDSIARKKQGNRVSALPHYESWMQRRKPKNPYLGKFKAGIERARKVILRIKELPPSKDGRQIELDASRRKALIDERTNKEYIDNFIKSCRYTLWNFLPRQLFAQFSKLANFYFLCVSVLQMIPGLSTTGNYTTIIPLIFFVSISMAKEGYEDYRRYKLDKQENNSEATVFQVHEPTEKIADSSSDIASSGSGPLHWATIKWHKIRVGDIIRLKRDEAVPADIILLHSAGPNGVAYVETMALDGETNLKSRTTTASLSGLCSTKDGIATCRARFVIEDPNPDLYRFEGRVIVDDDVSALTNSEVIYRGSVLRNTPEAIGVVIYTGEECKIRMNSNKNARIKAPHLQFVVNKIVVVVVIFVLSLTMFNSIAYQIWYRTSQRKAFYLITAKVPFHQIITGFFIMFNTMIPLSLYVAMEIIKLAQMVLLNDIDMYDPVSDTPFEARTSTINEELGQISYIFSDKILMHKKRGKGKKPARKSLQTPVDSSTNDETVHNSETQVETAGVVEPKWQSSARPAKHQPEMRTHDMIRYIMQKPYTNFARKTRLFLLSIALCHTCLPEKQEDGSIDFQASSPDELALVRAAQELGYLIVNRELGTLTLNYSTTLDVTGEQVSETYELLDVIEFSSKRKRMSVLVRFPNKRICVITKGADSVIMQRLKLASLASRKVTEIETRASRRKSMEAQSAIARKSSVQLDRKQSLSRPSVSMGRRSINSQRLQPVRVELDNWLKERERDVDMSNLEDNEQFYSARSPRASTQLGGGRLSLAISEARSSMQFDEDEELVDEALVVDDAAVIERCFQHINDFATEGLRTLLYAYRFITEDEYSGWKKIYMEATTSLVDRETKIEQAGELIEMDLDLAGATAIEDKLQVGVPEAIDKLRRANIKMWMLTGDKRETAINIGHSCRLIKDYSTVIVLDEELGEVDKAIASGIISLNDGAVAHCVVVVDGQTLSMIEENIALETLFYDLAIKADSVVCCRASPSQKAKLVKAIRHRVKNSITLAIGDGANDIAMIQEAHVGIGITGKEGLQAARTSDYSIAQFRFLTKLLLVHGRWNYIRTCKYVVGTFWKEMLFYLTQALYQRYNGYTGTSLYESWSLAMFNTLFTSLPVIFMGIFEKDLAASTLLAVPELYTKGQRDGAFNIKIYLGWMFMAASEAMIVYFSMLGLFGQVAFTEDNSLFAMGDLTFTACVILINLKMQSVPSQFFSFHQVIH
jgi:phospholipid-translocating ATPase